MYVNKAKTAIALGSIKVKTVVWGVGLGLMVLAFLGGLTEEMMEKYGWKGQITWVIIAAICGLFIFLNLQKKKKINLAYRLSNVFENDSDGTMMTNEIANAVHLATPVLEQNLLWLINNNYVINCRFDDRNQSRIILTDVNEAATNEFKLIQCIACGTQVQVRPGQGIKCPSCGTYIAP